MTFGRFMSKLYHRILSMVYIQGSDSDDLSVEKIFLTTSQYHEW